MRIVAVDLREQALQLAREAGGCRAAGLRVDWGDLRAEVGEPGATLVLDCVAAAPTLELAAGVVAPGGTLCSQPQSV